MNESSIEVINLFVKKKKIGKMDFLCWKPTKLIDGLRHYVISVNNLLLFIFQQILIAHLLFAGNIIKY